MSRRIMLSGVHGVGKGYFIKNKLLEAINLTVISASEIIGRYHDSEDAGNKRVIDVEANQKILLKNLTDLFIDIEENILLDGHLVILDSNDIMQRIPIEFFDKGMFDTLIVLQDDPNAIYDRMYKRDGIHKLDIKLISRIQENERLYAEELREKGIAVCYITPFSEPSTYMHLFEGD